MKAVYVAPTGVAQTEPKVLGASAYRVGRYAETSRVRCGRSVFASFARSPARRAYFVEKLFLDRELNY